MMKKRNIIMLISAGIIGWLSLTQADTHDEARTLRDQGDILPLETLLDKVRTDYPGKVIEVELEREYGNYLYEIEVLDNNGKLWELKYDAHNGELINKELDD
jgi:uncharacterized membrane protein YkoI